MIKIEFVVNKKKNKPPSLLFGTSFRNVIRGLLGKAFVTGAYCQSEKKAQIYLFNIWKAFKQSLEKKGVTLTKIITENIEHEVMHHMFHECSVPNKKHEYALNVIGIGHDNKERFYE